MHDFTALAAQVWRAVSPIAALSPGQRPGERRPRLIHSAFLRRRKNATRRKRVTHYALNATRGVAPGRCPGLCATFGLTARPTCAASTVNTAHVPPFAIGT